MQHTKIVSALLLASSLGMVLPTAAQAQTTVAKKAVHTKAPAKNKAKAIPAAKASISGDYIVAIVDREPVSNLEVNRQADQMASQISPTPPRAELLRMALDQVILQKAAVQYARNVVTVSEDELQQIEQLRARQAGVSVAEFRQRAMKAASLTQPQYFAALRDEVQIERARDARISAEVSRVSDQEALQLLRQENQRNGNAPMVMPEFQARHILLKITPQRTEQQALAKLAELRKTISSGKQDFATAARANSQDGSAAAGGELGWFEPGKMVPEFTQEVVKLQPGQISQPFLSRFGAHLVQLENVRQVPLNDQQQLALARNKLREQRSGLALQQWENELRNSTYIEMREAPR